MPFSRKFGLIFALLPVLGEAVCVFAAFATALMVARWPELPFWEAAAAQAPWPFILLFTWYIQAFDLRLYISRRSDLLIPQLTDVARAICTAALMTLFFMAVLKPGGVDRRFALAFCGSAVFYMLLFRMAARLSLWGLRGRGMNYRHILLVGSNDRTRRLAEIMRSHEQYGYNIVGFLEDDATRSHFLDDFDIPYLGSVKKLEELLIDEVVDVVYVTLPLRSQYPIIQDIAHLCEGIGVQVRLVGDLFFAESAACEVTQLEDIQILSFAPPALENKLNLPQTSEYFARGVVLFFLWPIIALLALMVWMDTKGPVLEWESLFDPRTRNNRRALRFHTTRIVAEAAGTPQQSVTRTGAFLLRYSLHELPELFQVGSGEEINVSADTPTTSTRKTAGEKGGDSPATSHGLYLFWPLTLLDTASMTTAYLWTSWEFFPWQLSFGQYAVSHAFYLLLFLALWFPSAMEQRLFRHWRMAGLQTYLFAIARAMGAALVIGTVVAGLLFKGTVEGGFLLFFCLSAPAIMLTTRLSFRLLLRIVQRKGIFMHQALVVGANERSLHLVRVLQSARHPEYTASKFLEDDPERKELLEGIGLRYAGGLDALPELLASGEVQAVYTCLPMRSSYEKIQEMIGACDAHHIPVALLADIFRLRIANNRLMYIEELPVISLSPVPETPLRLFMKRLIDFTLSSLMFIPLSPIFLTIGLLIKLDSPGPVFFGQERVGQNQRRFKMIKFRTMVINAEKLREELEAMNEADGPVFKIKKDPRITRIGGFMRKHSIDEFPQLFNVWLGHMSLVGPRPPIHSEVVQYSWAQRRRLSVRPGMTGLWQVSGRSDVGFDEWVELDLEYIDTWSLWQDFSILIRTFKEVFYGRGAS
jgi:exopolysaccharide biosynthesis polyprenyl glycosylphosphotransferase